jgi:hypothetical protein
MVRSCEDEKMREEGRGMIKMGWWLIRMNNLK